ncbi:hypothetical protein [Vallitalea maricola]|uniref:Uncharacterized protein n=1 Tax=Vallitalea maricola TaxID=3074433 RepID=A0ACB5UP76_9FIRM|nr:hypothetical protein AN2V17_39050 [Vallitalea sp. AN17-2]
MGPVQRHGKYETLENIINWVLENGVERMKIYEICNSNVENIAKLMAKIKPEFWSFEGALNQLSSGQGWYMGNDKYSPDGWILCKEYRLYKVLEIECIGYSDDGKFDVSSSLNPLISHIEEWAMKNNLDKLRFIISSRGMSCHMRELDQIWKELRDLEAIDREEFNWYLDLGFKPSGIIPNSYGRGFHGIELILEIV